MPPPPPTSANSSRQKSITTPGSAGRFVVPSSVEVEYQVSYVKPRHNVDVFYHLEQPDIVSSIAPNGSSQEFGLDPDTNDLHGALMMKEIISWVCDNKSAFDIQAADINKKNFIPSRAAYLPQQIVRGKRAANGSTAEITSYVQMPRAFPQIRAPHPGTGHATGDGIVAQTTNLWNLE